MSVLSTILGWLSPILDPLTDLPGHLNTLQQNHLDSVDTFSTLMSGLVGTTASSEQFAGSAAEQAFNTAGEYITSENTLSSIGGLIDDLSSLTTACTTDVGIAAEDLAEAVADDSGLIEVVAVVDIAAVAEGGANPVADGVALAGDLVVAGVLGWELGGFAIAIYNAVSRWLSGLNQAGSRPQPKLPSTPTPAPTPGPGTGNGLNKKQQQELNDIIARATQEGLPFDQLAIEDMIKAGLDYNTIMNFLRLRVPSLQQSDTNYGGHTLTDHVGMSYEALKERAIKDKAPATSYPNAQVAQSATDYVIAKSAILQNFIKNGAPGRKIEDTQCYLDGVQMPEDVQTLGYGYAKPVGNKAPVLATQPMRCATVVLVKNAKGEVFVLSSFPRPLFW